MKPPNVAGIAAALSVICGLSGCVTQPSVIVPLADANTCKQFIYSICDSDIKAKFPEIRATDKVLDYDTDDVGYTAMSLMVSYTPEVIEPNVVLTKELKCTQYQRGEVFHCVLYKGHAYFDVDPENYLAANVPPDQAKLVVHLWMQGRVVASDPAWVGVLTARPSNVRAFILTKASLGGYVLWMHSSGCNGPVHVRIEGAENQQTLKIEQAPDVMCV